MLTPFRSLFILITLLCLALCAGGCAKAPVRYLVADACMVNPGQTSRQEILKLMGEPDSKRMLSSTTEEWVYYEEKKSSLQSVPLVGDAFDPSGYHMIVVTLSGDTVLTCCYSGYEDDEFDWKDDYSWQEIEK